MTDPDAGETAVFSWWRPDTGIAATAIARAREAIEAPEAVNHLAEYYAAKSDYAGATFTALGTNDPMVVGTDDLLAVTTLSVSVGPHAIRTITESRAAELTERLQALHPELRLETMSPGTTARSMGELQDAMKAALGKAGAKTANAWVTASKLCARKRPNLFPVRDNVVLEYLGLPKTYPVDWPAFRAIMRDPELVTALTDLVERAGRRPETDRGDPQLLLRHLDVVLWRHALHTRKHRGVRSSETFGSKRS